MSFKTGNQYTDFNSAQYDGYKYDEDGSTGSLNLTSTNVSNNSDNNDPLHCVNLLLDCVYILDKICNIIFLSEFIVHFLSAPYNLRFFLSFLNIVDFLCFVDICLSATTTGWLFLPPFRMFRVMRFLKSYTRVQIIVKVIKASYNIYELQN